MALLKYSQIRTGFAAFCASPHQKSFLTKFCDLKGAVLRVDFGDAEHKRKSLMCDKEPKDAFKPPF